MTKRPADHRTLTVLGCVDVTPRMRRITFAGDDLGRFTSAGGLHVRMLFPAAGGHGAVPRAYTIRTLRADAGELDIDFVLHGDGIGAGWAMQVAPGQRIGVIGPIGRTIPADADRYLFAGDEAALPAIGRILEELPAAAQGIALVEIADAGERQALRRPAGIDLRWLERDAAGGSTLEQAVRAIALDGAARPFLWIGAEMAVYRAIRDLWRDELQLETGRFLAVPYWQHGKRHEKIPEPMEATRMEIEKPRRDPAELAAAWQAYRAANRMPRARDAADSLGVSEAELVAAGIGHGTTRLRPEWNDLLQALPSLGRVMALTRNAQAVHEKVGQYGRIMSGPERSVVLDPDINLRINFAHWRTAFAVAENDKRSLQFFDPYGTAVHKVHLRAESDVAAFDDLVARFAADDQTAGLGVFEPVPPMPDRPDAEIDVAGMERDWRDMQDTHDIFALTRRYRAGRVQAFRLMPDAIAQPVDNGAFSRALVLAAAEGEEVMIFVGSPGLVQIHIGPVHRVERRGPWQNVLDPGFDLHLREDGIASTWIIRKPTTDGLVTSIEIFDRDGGQIAWMFGKRKRGQKQAESWAGLVSRIAGG